jgi:pyruvate formate lyase activating enzyme
MFAEYLMEIARTGHDAGIRSVAVSNGYLQQEALRQIYGKMDAVKIDLKAFSEAFYHRIAKGRFKPVLESLITLRAMNKWTEIVYLVIPTLNDSDEELRRAAAWIKQHLGATTPLHFTQFHPEFQLKYLPVTPVAKLERAKAIAEAEGLNYVYIGNVPGHPAQNTICPQCHGSLVERAGFRTVKVMIGADGACPQCRHPIPGIWSG